MLPKKPGGSALILSALATLRGNSSTSFERSIKLSALSFAEFKWTGMVYGHETAHIVNGH